MLRHSALRSTAAAVSYGAPLLATYAVTGPLRAQILDPVLGGVTGAVVEAALFMPAIVLGGAAIPALLRIADHPGMLVRTGVLASGLFLVADAAIAVSLCGLTAAEHPMRFTAAPGWIQGTALAFFALFPWLWWRTDRVNAFAISPALPQLRW